MTRIAPSLFVASLLVIGLNATPAQALNTRSFISALGSDANPCTRSAPCRTLAFALTETSAKGEINILDPADYGTVTIDKSISIVNDVVGSAGILVPSGGTGITIDAGAADVIHLRGLTIEGAGVGSHGIVFNTGGFLTIENCVVRNLTSSGINLIPSANSTFSISNTYVADIGHGFGSSGILVTPNGAGETYNNGGNGIIISGSLSTGSVKATVADSVAAHNGGDGFAAFSNGATTEVTIVRSTAAHNAGGAHAQGSGATLSLAQSTMTGNVIAPWAATSSGVMKSYGDNYLDGLPGPTAIPKG
jgi:Right handed beta helix region